MRTVHIVWTPKGMLCAVLFFLAIGGATRLLGTVFDALFREFTFIHVTEAVTLLALVAYGLPIILNKLIETIAEDTLKIARAQSNKMEN